MPIKGKKGKSRASAHPQRTGGLLYELPPLPLLDSARMDGNERSPTTPERQHVINQFERNRRQEALRWRNFGGIQYDWKGWKRSANGTHTTTMRFSPAAKHHYAVALTCTGLKVSHRDKGAWSEWKMPNAGEEKMLIELCSQISGAPKAVVKPKPPTERHIWKRETCTGSLIECATRL